MFVQGFLNLKLLISHVGKPNFIFRLILFSQRAKNKFNSKFTYHETLINRPKTVPININVYTTAKKNVVVLCYGAAVVVVRL